ncbi:MAG: LptA/OstA family protein [Dongiaceae bacterium]
MRYIVILLLMIAMPAWATPAQGFGLLSSKKEPVEVSADAGIEWRRQENIFIAKGNAQVKSGNVILEAAELRALYRTASQNSKKNDLGGMEIYRFEAVGPVTITSPDGVVKGGHAYYDVDQAVAVVSGDNVSLTAGSAEVNAGSQLEYWQERKIAVARGGARVRQGGQALNATTLVGEFKEGRDGLRLSLVRAEGQVAVITKDGVARANQGEYDLTADKARLIGNVRLTQGSNELRGDEAVVDMQSGISSLVAKGGGRVKGLFVPKPQAPAQLAPMS